MADFKLTDRTMAVLQKSLDLRTRKQQVIAGNVANAETPGYSARKMEFEADLRSAINSPETKARTSHPKHFPIGVSGLDGVQGQITKQRSENPIGDGNTVSLEEEMFDMAQNQLLFEASGQILKKKLVMLKYAASDGK
jgi:flagellar basal-body rod protein FlgB